MEREWRDVVGAEPDYSVSDDGHIMTKGSSGNCNKGKKPRIIRGTYDGLSNHQYFSMYGNGVNAAKTVAEAFIENPNNYKYIYFKDRNKRNVRADNLEWAEFTFNKEMKLRDEKIVAERLEKVRELLLEHDSVKEEVPVITSSPKGAWMDSPNRVVAKILTNEYHIIPETDN